MERRVVITGLGAITPLGESAIELWDGIKSKKCGIDEITLIDTSNFKTKLAGEVKNYDYLKYFDVKQGRRLDRVSQFALIAGREAFKTSGITNENTNFDDLSNSFGEFFVSIFLKYFEYRHIELEHSEKALQQLFFNIKRSVV